MDRWTELVDWVDGRLEPGDAERVALDVRAGRGTADIRWLRGFRRLARMMRLEEPPPVVRQNLRRELRRRLGHGPAGAREVTGRLLFDSRDQLAVAGLRTTDTDEGVHVGFAAPGVELFVDVHPAAGPSPHSDPVDLSGQVFVDRPTDAPVFEARVSGAGWTSRTLDGDALGRFDLTGLPSERCTLRVSNGELTMTVGLDLRRDDHDR